MVLYYDKEGRPIELMEWVRLCEDPEYRRVGLDRFDLYEVSTVWLGLDYGMLEAEPPLIFESAVINHGKPETVTFAGVKRRFFAIEICERYSTLEEARQGHEALCARVRSAVTS